MHLQILCIIDWILIILIGYPSTLGNIFFSKVICII
jgi:hypothetical protein